MNQGFHIIAYEEPESVSYRVQVWYQRNGDCVMRPLCMVVKNLEVLYRLNNSRGAEAMEIINKLPDDGLLHHLMDLSGKEEEATVFHEFIPDDHGSTTCHVLA